MSKKKYVLVRITNLEGRIRTSKEYVNRLGRTFCIDPTCIKIGRRFLMECVSPGFEKSMITSTVNEVVYADDGIIVITDRSKYYLVFEEAFKRSAGEY